ncbi:MAG: response regulator, partial [Actinomycetota bacterium]|nr:response regulator [Actinomycetota bacterium]
MRHIVIVANQTLVGRHLHDRVAHILAVDPHTRFHIVVPATGANGPEPNQALNGARRRLAQAFEALDDVGAQVTGEVGPEHPVVAVHLAIERLQPDLLLLSTLPAGASRWVHLDLPHRLHRRFGIPVEVVEAEAETPTESAGVFQPPAGDGSIDDTVHVMLVDDNPFDVDLIGLALDEAGTPNQLRVAHDGANALSFLRALGHAEVDLVLFELKLPVIDGFELLQEVRANPDLDRVMMVALTGSEVTED